MKEVVGVEFRKYPKIFRVGHEKCKGIFETGYTIQNRTELDSVAGEQSLLIVEIWDNSRNLLSGLNN